MKLGFLELPPDERRLYIAPAATRRNVSPVVLEKDFWVCWLLGILFESEFAGSLVFKGGTSLSKVFGVIERFSEDIDLSLSPEFLHLPYAGTSRNHASKWMTKAETMCGAAVRAQIGPAIEEAVEAVLGKGQPAWFEFLTDPKQTRRCSYFINRRRSRQGSITSNARSSWNSALSPTSNR